MPQYKLTYFNVKGLGEPIRFILSYAGVNFVDNRIERSDWPKYKSTMPFGQVPVLEIDGKAYSQTFPICRYLAKQFNIGGKTDLDALEIDGIVNAIFDLRKLLSLYYFETDPALKATKKETLAKETVPYYMSKLDEIVGKNNGYFHDGELTYADLVFVSQIPHMNAFLDFDVVAGYKNLTLLQEKISTIPRIAEWIANRPETAL